MAVCQHAYDGVTQARKEEKRIRRAEHIEQLTQRHLQSMRQHREETERWELQHWQQLLQEEQREKEARKQRRREEELQQQEERRRDQECARRRRQEGRLQLEEWHRNGEQEQPTRIDQLVQRALQLSVRADDLRRVCNLPSMCSVHTVFTVSVPDPHCIWSDII